ncbi:MAG: FAD-binding oxidoreductase [Deltaproteobacteria bacterium]|nr:FAD-binding oxidoreductase [Deltaproteobacteria bacterium]
MKRFKGNIELRHKLTDIFGPDRVREGALETLIYSHRPWTRSLLEMKAGRLPERLSFIVWPETVEEVSRLLRLANEWKVPVIPMGTGSHRRGAPAAPGGIACDMKRMKRLLSFDEDSMIVSAQAGMLIWELERTISRRGYTLGHVPPTAPSSTIGGAIATRQAGRLSARYGRIEEMIVSLQAVLPDGSIVKTRTAPRSATGPDLDHLLIGSEGALGIITRAKLRVALSPERRVFAAHAFSSFENGARALRLVVRAGLRPSGARLMDVDETRAAFRGTKTADEKCVLCLAFEGREERPGVEEEIAAEIGRKADGKALGEEPSRVTFERSYLDGFRRHHVLAETGGVADVMDFAAPWSRVGALYGAVRKALKDRAEIRTVLGHPTPNGASLSFFVTARAENGDATALFDALWADAQRAAGRGGGGVAHHFGGGAQYAARLFRRERIGRTVPAGEGRARPERDFESGPAERGERIAAGREATVSDLFTRYFKEIDYCTFCPKMCRFSCPVANVTGNETYTPWGRQTVLHLVREGHLPFNREAATAMYQCANCMLCREYCDYLVEVPPVMIAARAKAVEEKLAPHEVIEYRDFSRRKTIRTATTCGRACATWCRTRISRRTRKVVYFAGCSHLYHYPQAVQDTFRVFEAMRVDYVACHEGEAMCCGAPLRELGLEAPYKRKRGEARGGAVALQGDRVGQPAVRSRAADDLSGDGF